MATDRRLLELALKGLQAERTHIDEEIAGLRAQLGEGDGPVRRKKTRRKAAGKKTAKKRGRKKMSSAQKKLISEKMRAAWARRKRAQKSG
jgi:hypothetical protein